jgi:predicted polyphosphate/ATP-dependent NAD kinase
MARVGLIVNPIAGLGGRVGLKGTDGAEVLGEARALGAVPLATERAGRALERLELRCGGVRLVAAAGAMGAELAALHGFETEALPNFVLSQHKVGLSERGGNQVTTAEDTRAAAAELARRGVDLILFAGGDGTARDIHDVVGERVPILGVPTGVKMHSGVFATTPESAGDVAAAFIASHPRGSVREAEVLDIDEDAVRAGRVSTCIYGAACVPDDRLRVQAAKSSAAVPADEVALEAACAAVANALDPRRIYVLGPGTTMRRVASHLGLAKTLLGVDAVRANCLLGADLGERELLELIADEPVTLLLGVVGGQGALLGRGNQQLSPAVLRRIGAANIEVIAGLRKLLALDPPLLRVDTGDPELDRALCGYRRVHVAPRRTVVYRVAA